MTARTPPGIPGTPYSILDSNVSSTILPAWPVSPESWFPACRITSPNAAIAGR
jgi:hypothetical protein